MKDYKKPQSFSNFNASANAKGTAAVSFVNSFARGMKGGALVTREISKLSESKLIPVKKAVLN